MVSTSRDNYDQMNKKVAPRDKLRGHLMYVPLTGFEPVTCNIVSVPLYPMSYSGTQKWTYGFFIGYEAENSKVWINELHLPDIVSVLGPIELHNKSLAE